MASKKTGAIDIRSQVNQFDVTKSYFSCPNWNRGKSLF